MTDFLKCPACGTQVAIDPSDRDRVLPCEKCGEFVSPKSSGWNPYAPPSSSFGQEADGSLRALEVPSSFFGKFGLAFRLLGDNLLLYSLIMLTVWLPANIAIEFLAANALPGQEVFATIRWNSLLQGIFGPISIGALIFAVAKRMEGTKVGYFEAIGVGFQNWGRLFAANFFAGIYVILGYIALIVPGIILSIRYSLLAPVVILERGPAPRDRSTELTAGIRWRIFWSGVFFYSIFTVSNLALASALVMVEESVEWLNETWVSIGVDCLFNVLECVFTTVIVFFYLESRDRLPLGQAKPSGDFEFQTRMSEV